MESENSSYRGLAVKLPAFEGPLDLLLHLIDKNKVDIYDIPIAQITEQYLDYVRSMEESDLDVTSEFLVMAATLIDIKCRMLLPREVNEEGEEEDPRAELVEKLLEYKMYRYMAGELRERLEEGDQVLYHHRDIPEEVARFEEPLDYEALMADKSLRQLGDIFEALMRRQEDRVDQVRSGFGRIEREEVDLDEKTAYVQAFIREHETFSFTALLETQNSRAELIVTFLVILEEMKQGEISIEQAETFGDIMIRSLVFGCE
ncbi:MAG: segregation/condensation protein A [Butyrivibrio sp.]|nr:segregation/condensation protein A [Butyrivibrio sp.]